MNKRRLLKLADFLETAELPGEFDMSTWGELDIRADQSFGLVDAPKCKTVACALGWATTIPAFKRAGLTGTFGHYEDVMLIEFDGDEGTSAAASFFDIDRYSAEDLFNPNDKDELTGKRGRHIVAKRIRKLVASAA